MLRTTLPAAFAFACLAVVESAHAQTAVSGLGTKGQFIVSADRLFGINVWSQKTEPQATPTDPNPDPASKLSGTGINLLWGGDAAVGSPNAPVYSIPRLGIDYLVIGGLTVGGAIGYFHRSGSQESTAMNGVTTSVDLPSGNGFLFHPRAGYIFDFTPLLSVWARGGFTYYWDKSEGTVRIGQLTGTAKTSNDGLALTIDPQLVITPVPHVGFMVGPMFDLPLAGSQKGELTGTVGNVTTTTTTEANRKITNWGISAGVLAYF
jgi:hypothetical protein